MRPTRLAALATGLSLAALAPATAAASSGHGAAFTETNSATGNRIAVYAREADGGLHWVASVPAGGRGTGANLGSQGAVALAPGGGRLYAVNAGSDSLAVFGVDGARAWRLQVVPSGGRTPVSVTAGHGFVYVLNAGGTPSVRGFRVTAGGLSPIDGGSRSLTAADAGPAEVAINPAGTRLIVTDKATSTIDTFAVRADGSLGPARSQASDGATPFGFAFTANGTAIVSDAAQAPTSAATAYRFGAGGALVAVSGPLQTNQLAACWVAAAPDGRLAFVADAHSGTISSLRVSRTGAISLVSPGGVNASGGSGSTTLDEAVTPDGGVLTVLVDNARPGVNALESFRIRTDGTLRRIDAASGLAASDVGLAVS